MNIFNPIIALIHNQKLGRYHPVLFSESPLPGPHHEGKPIRHKSKGHHTVGFETRELALENARTVLAQQVKDISGQDPALRFESDFEWDGEGIPALSVFFVATSSEAVSP